MKDDWPEFEKYNYQTLLDVYEKIDGVKYPGRKARVAELIEQNHGHDSQDSAATESVNPRSISLRYDTFWPRFFAGLIDGIALSIIAYAISVVLAVVPDWIQSPVDTVMLFDVYVYSVLLHGFFGQTLGKIITGVKVVNFQGENSIDLRQAFIRDAVPIGITLLAVIIYLGFESAMKDNGIGSLPVFFQFVVGASLIWFVLEIVTMLSNDKRRALHDFIADTIVVNTRGQQQQTMSSRATQFNDD